MQSRRPRHGNVLGDLKIELIEEDPSFVVMVMTDGLSGENGITAKVNVEKI